ncbi:HAMP domain protein [Mycobacterium kansasii]|uniref:histidine kinase n=1 Tax=Mycobacterium kansasii TaxID=1768 RepID=A0A1V3WHV4_MYCKA|nr:HAMP domain protein [Mycobacterium kansasii]
MLHPLPDGSRLILVADTTQTTQVTRQLRQLMIAAGLATLAVAALLLVAVSRTALRPLDRLTALAKDITTGDRGRRLRPDRSETELGRAASAFDGMLDALEASELRARQAAEAAQRAESATRQFLVDAAHELRTPIAGIQAAAEQLATSASQHEADSVARGQYRRASLLLSDVRRAGRLVADMLDLSRIDAGLSLDVHDTDLGAIVDAEVHRAAMLAPNLTVSRTGLSSLTIAADPTRVAQILSNLLDNARRYTPAGGSITVELSAGGGVAEVTVIDTGPGVPTTSATVSSSAWYAWTPDAPETTVAPGWACPSHGRWLGHMAVTWCAWRMMAARNSGSRCLRSPSVRRAGEVGLRYQSAGSALRTISPAQRADRARAPA